MNTNVEALIVITTVPDEILAVKITESLLQQSFAACVHVLPAGRSHYRWQGKIEQAAEITLVIKTSRERYRQLEDEIKRLHPYEVPEILALTVETGLPAYLEWIANETR
ncbi:MAG: divalent-cation tolerance protein CutA [Betaproteobacteria bacterium]